MGTMTKSQTISITGNDVRQVADCIWDQVGLIEKHYGIRLPCDMQKMRLDLGQILIWGMTREIKLQFYDKDNNERLTYGFVPNADPTAVHSPPGQFPRFEIPPGLQVRLVAEQGICLRWDSCSMTAGTQKCTACPSLAAAALEA
jgi:hypothetical protein